MKKIILTVFTAMFLVSCSEDVITEKANVSQTNISSLSKVYKNKNKLESDKNLAFSGEMKRSIDEIKGIAVKIATKMRVKSGVVTKAPIQIKSIEVVNGTSKKPYIKTKGAELNDDAVLINFDGNQGYVLVSPDKRVPSVLGFSSHGNLVDLNNPGVQVLFSRIPFYVRKKIGEFERVRPELKKAKEEDLFKKLSNEKKQDLRARGFFDDKGKRIVRKSGGDELKNVLFKGKYCYDTSVVGRVGAEIALPNSIGPLLKTLWAQSGDYNDNVTTECGDDQASVGCVAVAVGQLMAYHKYPSMFKKRKMHWDKMTKVDSGDFFSKIYYLDKVGQDDIKFLLYSLGADKDLLKMKYRCNGSGTPPEKAVKTFRKLGYTASDLKSFDKYKVFEQLRFNRPVYMSGKEFKETHSDGAVTYDGGHSWVVDGVMDVQFVEYDGPCGLEKRNLEVIYEETYLHNNFGWGGRVRGDIPPVYDYDYDRSYTSGWYIVGVFDVSAGPLYGSREVVNELKSSDSDYINKEGKEDYFQFNLRYFTVKK